jgi:hypothetical protein
VRSDVGDDAFTDEHVAVDEVTEARVDSDDVAALNKDLFGHDGSNLRKSVNAGSDKREGQHGYRQSRFDRV